MAQYESRKLDFSDAGVRVVFVAAQKREGIFHPEKHFAGQPGSFPFLLDEDRAVTKAYGVFHRFGGTHFTLRIRQRSLSTARAWCVFYTWAPASMTACRWRKC